MKPHERFDVRERMKQAIEITALADRHADNTRHFAETVHIETDKAPLAELLQVAANALRDDKRFADFHSCRYSILITEPYD